MQKVIIDTNILVSSIIQKSYPYFIVNELFIEDKIDLCVSDSIMLEYYDVLTRPKFSKFHDFVITAESLLADIELNSSRHIPTIKLDLISDKDDNKFLELADICEADFTFSIYKNTKIVTPKEYWENNKPN
jgi:hypothetical protein